MPRNYDIEENEITLTKTNDYVASKPVLTDIPTLEIPRKLLRGGWAQVDALKATDAQFAQRLKVSEEVQVVKFLSDEPYAAWHQHWVERDGQKSFICIREMEERGCPICESGNRPSSRIAFNVALCTVVDPPINRSFEVGPRVVDQLRNLNKAPQSGPLTKHYWAVSRSGKGATTAYNLQVIRERDLAEEWHVTPIDETEQSKLSENKYTSEIIKVPTYAELFAIASEDLGR